MKIIISAGVLLSLSIFNTLATPEDDVFKKTAHDYIEQYLQANPEDATELGDHRFDGQLTDYSVKARAKELATQKAFRDKLSAIDGSQLASANNVDFRILKENIDYKIFEAEELKKVAPERCVATLRRQFSSWRGEVPEEAAFRARVGSVDGRDYGACAY